MGRGQTLARWNVVATSAEGEFRRAARALAEWGPVSRTDYYNVLVAEVEAPRAVLTAVAGCAQDSPQILSWLKRVVPCDRTFDFQDRGDFTIRARETVLGWADALAGASFHVRMHRRGFKRQLSSQEIERCLVEDLMGHLAERGQTGFVAFDDPDAIISVETVGGRAGLSLWTRDELKRFPFLGLD